jgi:hypothetical protein
MNLQKNKPTAIQYELNTHDSIGCPTALKITGEIIIAGNRQGNIYTYDVEGNQLDCVQGNRRGKIQEIGLIDAYRKRPYARKTFEGVRTTDHHAMLALDSFGKLWVHALNVSNDANVIPTGSLKVMGPWGLLEDCNVKAIRCYGDIVIGIYEKRFNNYGYTLQEKGTKIFMIRWNSETRYTSNPERLPEVLTFNTYHFKAGFQPILRGVPINIGHVGGKYAWDWQCITVVHNTGTIYKCFMPNHRIDQYHPKWKKYSAKQDFTHLKNFSNNALKLVDKRSTYNNTTFCIVEPLIKEHANSNLQTCQEKRIVIGKTVFKIIHNKQKLIEMLDLQEECELIKLHKQITFSIVYKDITILYMGEKNLLLCSSDGYYYRIYNMRELYTISSITIQNNVLLLGGEDGKMRGFILGTTTKIVDLNMSHPSWVEHICSTGIKNIHSSFICKNKITFVCNTKEKIYMFKKTLDFIV